MNVDEMIFGRPDCDVTVVPVRADAASLFSMDTGDLEQMLQLRVLAHTQAAAPELTEFHTNGVAAFRAVPESVREGISQLAWRIFHRWNREAQRFFCSPEAERDRDRLLTALQIGGSSAAGYLASALAGLGLAAGVAAVVGALVVQYFLASAHDEICLWWGEQLQDSASSL